MLAAQLQLLSGNKNDARRLPARVSFLFDAKEAADMGFEIITSIGITGFHSLCQIDSRFKAYENSLFGNEVVSSVGFDRQLLTKEVNNKLNESLSLFLRLLSPYFLLPAAHKVLEFLIRRYQINTNSSNTEHLFACILPFHATVYFARMLQLTKFNKPRWNFLLPTQKNGSILTRNALVSQCLVDHSLLQFIITHFKQSVDQSILTKHDVNGPLLRFFTALIVEYIQRRSLSEKATREIVSHLLYGFSSCFDVQLSSCIILTELSNSCQLDVSVTSSLLTAMFKGVSINSSVGVLVKFIKSATVVFQSQNIVVFPSSAFAFAAKIDYIVDAILDIQTEPLVFDAFLSPFLESLSYKCLDSSRYRSLLYNLIDRVTFSSKVMTKICTILLGHLEKNQIKDFSEILALFTSRFRSELDIAINTTLSQAGEDFRSDLLKKIAIVFQHTIYEPLSKTNTTLFHSLSSEDPEIRIHALDKLCKWAKEGTLNVIDDTVLCTSLLDLFLHESNPLVIKSLYSLSILSFIPPKTIFDRLLFLLNKHHKSLSTYSSDFKDVALLPQTIIRNNSESAQIIIAIVSFLSDLIDSQPSFINDSLPLLLHCSFFTSYIDSQVTRDILNVLSSIKHTMFESLSTCVDNKDIAIIFKKALFEDASLSSSSIASLEIHQNPVLLYSLVLLLDDIDESYHHQLFKVVLPIFKLSFEDVDISECSHSSLSKLAATCLQKILVKSSDESLVFLVFDAFASSPYTFPFIEFITPFFEQISNPQVFLLSLLVTLNSPISLIRCMHLLNCAIDSDSTFVPYLLCFASHSSRSLRHAFLVLASDVLISSKVPFVSSISESKEEILADPSFFARHISSTTFPVDWWMNAFDEINSYFKAPYDYQRVMLLCVSQISNTRIVESCMPIFSDVVENCSSVEENSLLYLLVKRMFDPDFQKNSVVLKAIVQTLSKHDFSQFKCLLISEITHEFVSKLTFKQQCDMFSALSNSLSDDSSINQATRLLLNRVTIPSKVFEFLVKKRSTDDLIRNLSLLHLKPIHDNDSVKDILRFLFNLLLHLNSLKPIEDVPFDSLESAKQLTLILIDNWLKNYSPSSKVSLNLFAFVDCIRSTNAQTRHSTLSCICTLARMAPSLVVSCVASVFESVSNISDSYGFLLLTQTVHEVVPVLIRGSTDINDILMLFIDSLSSIQEDRRLPLLLALSTAISTDNLHNLIFLLTTKLSQDGFVLASSLLQQFPLGVQTNCLVHTISLSKDLSFVWLEGLFNLVHTQLVKQTEFVDHNFDVLLANGLQILSSFNTLSPPKSLLEALDIVFEDIVASIPLTELFGIFNDVFLRSSDDSLIRIKVLTLLVEQLYKVQSSALLQQEDSSEQMECMLILINSLSNELGSSNSTNILLYSTTIGTIDQLISYFIALCEAQSLALTEANHKLFLSILSRVVDIFASFPKPSTENSRICIASLKLSSTLTKVLGSKLVPFFPTCFEYTVAFLEHSLDTLSTSLVLASLSTLSTYYDTLPQFSHLILDRQFAVLFSSNILVALKNNSTVMRSVNHILTTMASKIAARLMFTPLFAHFNHILTSAEADEIALEDSILIRMIDFLSEITNNLRPEAVALHHKRVFGFYIQNTFDLRLSFGSKLLSIDTVENSLIKAFSAFVLKLNETQFMDIFPKILDWVSSSDLSLSNESSVLVIIEATVHRHSISRAITFMHIVESLTSSLRYIFVPFFRFFWESCIGYLSQDTALSQVIKRQKTSFQSIDNGSIILIDATINSLLCCFTHDTVSFFDVERAESIMQPLVGQLVSAASMRSPEQYQSFVINTLQPCLVQFATLLGNETKWKPMNRELLLHTRNPSPLIRFAALKVVQGLFVSLSQQTLNLLPELLPFISELMEDENAEVEALCKEFISMIEEFSGENISQYLV